MSVVAVIPAGAVPSIIGDDPRRYESEPREIADEAFGFSFPGRDLDETSGHARCP